MISYSERKIFSPYDRHALRDAQRIVDELPNFDQEGRDLRCHEVARIVGTRLGLKVVDGIYELGCEHSWCDLPSGHILDPYAVGRIPHVQLVAVVLTLPKRYRAKEPRDDIRQDVIDMFLPHACCEEPT